MAKNRSMISVGGDSLTTDDQHLLQGTHILVFSGRNAELIGQCLGHDCFLVVGSPGGAIRQGARRISPKLFLDRLANLEGLLYPVDDHVIVPSRVGDGGEKGFTDEAAGVFIHRAFFLQLFPENRNPLHT